MPKLPPNIPVEQIAKLHPRDDPRRRLLTRLREEAAVEAWASGMLLREVVY